jgi:hypothetical protein
MLQCMNSCIAVCTYARVHVANMNLCACVQTHGEGDESQAAWLVQFKYVCVYVCTWPATSKRGVADELEPCAHSTVLFITQVP